jgi:hypothetical protein
MWRPGYDGRWLGAVIWSSFRLEGDFGQTDFNRWPSTGSRQNHRPWQPRVTACLSSSAMNGQGRHSVHHPECVRPQNSPSLRKPESCQIPVPSTGTLFQAPSDGQGRLHHSLDLNEIHVALKRTGSLVYWTPETEIRSRNDLTTAGYWKYYDAVVVVRLAGQDCRFALEYERTPKAARQYLNARQRIEQETSIAHFLYLMPNYDLLWFVADKLSGCRRAVHFGLLKDFLSSLWHCQ